MGSALYEVVTATLALIAVAFVLKPIKPIAIPPVLPVTRMDATIVNTTLKGVAVI